MKESSTTPLDDQELQRLSEAAEVVGARLVQEPAVVLVLGSGLSSLADEIEDAVVLAQDEIPHMPRSTVQAHDGSVVAGELFGVSCLALRGRFHLYEGYSAAEVVRPVRLARMLGAKTLVVTNAAGGIRDDLHPGDLMLIEDHLNLSGATPLTGTNHDALGPRFPDMTTAYDPALRAIARQAAEAEGFALAEGVYAGLPGPAYETPAEIRMLGVLGADAVGMSTVNEVIAAVHAGMSVLGLSCITNRAAGLSSGPLSHDEVVETTTRVAARNRSLLRRLLPQLVGDTA